MSTVLGTLREVLHSAPWDSKSSLHNGRGLASPAAVLFQLIMCLRGADDDLSCNWTFHEHQSLRDRPQYAPDRNSFNFA